MYGYELFLFLFFIFVAVLIRNKIFKLHSNIVSVVAVVAFKVFQLAS